MSIWRYQPGSIFCLHHHTYHASCFTPICHVVKSSTSARQTCKSYPTPPASSFFVSCSSACMHTCESYEKIILRARDVTHHACISMYVRQGKGCGCNKPGCTTSVESSYRSYSSSHLLSLSWSTLSPSIPVLTDLTPCG